MYTLLRGGQRGEPTVKRVIVVCPCSLVNNWAQEFEKWINGRVKSESEKVRVLPMSGACSAANPLFCLPLRLAVGVKPLPPTENIMFHCDACPALRSHGQEVRHLCHRKVPVPHAAV